MNSSHSRARRPPAPTAFTLIELLVVISIISVLIALLLPALSQAREQTRTIACASNVRQIAIAVRAYTDSNGNNLPWGSVDAKSVGLFDSNGIACLVNDGFLPSTV